MVSAVADDGVVVVVMACVVVVVALVVVVLVVVVLVVVVVIRAGCGSGFSCGGDPELGSLEGDKSVCYGAWHRRPLTGRAKRKRSPQTEAARRKRRHEEMETDGLSWSVLGTSQVRALEAPILIIKICTSICNASRFVFVFVRLRLVDTFSFTDSCVFSLPFFPVSEYLGAGSCSFLFWECIGAVWW